MRTLILIRHAMVHVDPERPSHTWTLSADGRSACARLAAKLAPYQPGVIVCSQEPKAHATGQETAGVLGIPCHTAPGLHEHLRHTTPYFDSKSAFETAVARFFSQPDELVLGEETAAAAADRFATAVAAVMADRAEPTVAIATHGTVLTLYVSGHNPHVAPIPFWQQLTLPAYAVLSYPQNKLLATG